MKINKYVVMIFVLLIGLIFVYCYLSFSNNNLKPLYVKVQLEINSDNQLEITNDSIAKIEKAINENMVVKDQDKLLETFNQEKSNYVNLITIISILLTVFTLFTAITSFVEKSEVTKLSDEMNKKILEYKTELKNIYFNTIISYLQKIKGTYLQGSDIYIDNNEKVSDLPSMLKAVNMDLDGVFQYSKNKELEGRIIDKAFYIEYIHVGIAMIEYSSKRGYIKNNYYNVNKNEIFRILITTMYCNIGKDHFEEFKKTVNSFLPVDWGRY